MFTSALTLPRRWRHVGTPTTPLLQPAASPNKQRKLTMSKRRLMMKQKHYCKPTSSVPICVMLMSFCCYMIYQTRYGCDDDRMFR